MKWSNRIQIITGQTCLHIVLHLAMIGTVIWGWKHQQLMQVSLILLTLYGLIFTVMSFSQRLSGLRRVGDFFEELTTTYYFGAAMLTLYLISHFLHNNLLLACIGIVILVGPMLISLLARDHTHRHQRRHR